MSDRNGNELELMYCKLTDMWLVYYWEGNNKLLVVSKDSIYE